MSEQELIMTKLIAPVPADTAMVTSSSVAMSGPGSWKV